MVAYMSIIRILNANANATEAMLQEKARTKRVFISYDNPATVLDNL